MEEENELTQSIARALREEFGVPVALGPLPQGLTGPQFFVLRVRAVRRAYPARRILAQNEYRVDYLPADRLNARAACEAAAQRLFACLAVIGPDTAPLRGTKMACTFEDGLLHFSVRYDYFCRAPDTSQAMERIEVQVGGAQRS